MIKSCGYKDGFFDEVKNLKSYLSVLQISMHHGIRKKEIFYSKKY